MTKSITHEEFINKCVETLEYFNDYEILTKYKNSRVEIKIFHKKCGNSYMIKPSKFLYDRQQCKNCNKGRSGSKTLTEKEFTDKIIELEGNNYKLISNYNGLSKKVKLIHSCGEILNCTPSEFIKRNKRCKYCSGKRTNLNIIYNRINNIDNEYTLNLKMNKDIEYKNVHTRIYIKHIKCGETFLKSFNNFRNGQRCPFCEAKVQESIACREINKFLEDNNIKYETEVTRDGLIYIRKLRIDYYLPEYNIYIEYDGKQHFKYENNGIFDKESFELIKLRDSIKNEFCKNNNLKLYRINYLDNHILKLKSILEESSTTIETK